VDGDLEAAISCYEEAAALVTEMGAREDLVLMQVRLADLRMRRGDLHGARVHIREARRMSEETGSAIEGLFANSVLAECARVTGDLAEGRRLAHDSIRRLEQFPPAHPIQMHARALMLSIAAKQDVADGMLDAAREHIGAAYEAALGTKDMPIVASVGVAAADLAVATGRFERAAELLGAAARLRGADDATNLDVRRLTERLREALGAGFEVAYDRGRALDRATAIARFDPAGR
jgi:ATP/maltotriose-dependent transcriptional regulator MalT